MISALRHERRGAEEIWNAGLDVIDELIAPHHRLYDPLVPDLPPGPDGVRKHLGALLTAMPDALVTVDRWSEGRELAVMSWTISGTHTGELMGMAPTGRQAAISGQHVCRFEADMIVETWVAYDALDLLSQLGLITLGISLGQ